ncbi:Ion transport protein-domain-containing protein, partial [Blyttiomyces helicus]
NVTKREQKHINFSDIVDMDDEAFETHVSEDLAARLGEGDMFRLAMIIAIFFNALLIATQTYSDVIDYILLAIFSMEIVFKWYYGFQTFWMDWWNIFDFSIIAISLVGPGWKVSGSGAAGGGHNHTTSRKVRKSLLKVVPLVRGAGSALTFVATDTRVRTLRILRSLRALRSISFFRGMAFVAGTILDSLPDMANIIVLLLITMFIWAVVGVTLFSATLPAYFGDLGSTMFTLFIMVTQIGWVEIFDELEAAGMFTIAALYFSSFMLVGAFILMKIIIAVVVANLEESYNMQRKDVKRKNRRLKSDSTQGHKRFQRPIVSMPAGDDPVWTTQIPYEVPDFDKISKTKLENYFLILSIIEENLAEYVKIKEALTEIQLELKVTNLHDLGDPDETDKSADDLGSDLSSLFTSTSWSGRIRSPCTFWTWKHRDNRVGERRKGVILWREGVSEE